MKKKGFTLIELLAIIVILAIIAVITVPIILNIIENSRKGAAIDSAYGYKDAISKYYITELAKDPNYGELNGTYTVNSDGSITGENEQNYPISFSGTSPKGGSLTIDKGTVTNGCLTIGNYALTLSNSEVTATQKGDCNSLVQGDEPTIPAPDKFETDSWETIVDAVKNDNTGNYKIGDTKTVDLGELGQHTLRIANTTTPSECNGNDFSQTACGFVLEFADIITKRKMNTDDNNHGGWKDSEMRKYLNCTKNGKSAVENSGLVCTDFNETTIYDLLPEELKKAIIDTRVVSGHESGVSENYTTTDKLYLLATAEIWEDGSSNKIGTYDTARDNTRQLDYYNGVTTDEGYDKAIKKYGSSATSWWLRSVDSKESNLFFIAINTGDWSGDYADYTYGVAPAFRIGSQ